MGTSELSAALRGGLVVSCQALPGEPLHTEAGGVMPLLAEAAARAGAVAIRANSARDVSQIRVAVALPVIGLIKKVYEPWEPYITPSMAEVDALVAAGAEVIAIDATSRKRVGGIGADEFVAAIRARHPDQPLMADVSTHTEGVSAAQSGVDFVGTTLSGHTPESEGAPTPDFPLVERLARDLEIPVIAEGGIATPAQARRMIDLGAHCVVVGGAITRPMEIARRFVAALR